MSTNQEKLPQAAKKTEHTKKPSAYQHVIHCFAPVYNEHSRILILGTFPSVKSREQQFFYGHPQNRFWKLLALLTDSPAPSSIEEKKALLLNHKIAIWDVIESCDIIGSSDSSIRNVIPCDINRVLSQAPIKAVFGNGAKACVLYERYLLAQTGRPIEKLPSTSPANASFSLNRLAESWSCIRKYIH